MLPSSNCYVLATPDQMEVTKASSALRSVASSLEEVRLLRVQVESEEQQVQSLHRLLQSLQAPTDPRPLLQSLQAPTDPSSVAGEQTKQTSPPSSAVRHAAPTLLYDNAPLVPVEEIPGFALR
ncbi:hypothetical protein FHG87_003045 [Trinorchestia longiramus]|nr:hypothetical protein FHG87_003045 [Trinorchestia longiramus]